MSYLECEYRNGSLGKPTSFIALIPEGAGLDGKPIKTLYLLHGLTDSYHSWTRNTSVDLFAHERNMAVIMPDAGRSFYTNMKDGPAYFNYITDELVQYTRRLFHLSDRREDTFVCGNSMGGYGAFKSALSRPDLFGAAVSFSGVTDIAQRFDRLTEWNYDKQLIWGMDHTVGGTRDDLMKLVTDLENEAVKPLLWQICGTEDFLYEDNQTFRKFMEGRRFDYHYTEGPGLHNWNFWQIWLPAAMDWFLSLYQN